MSYSIRIEQGIPLAGKREIYHESIAHPLSWLLRKLKVGDSFVYPASTCEKFPNLRSIANGYAKRWNMKFATRAVKGRDGVEELRFWRTK